MKTKTLIAAGIGLVLGFCVNNSQGQVTNAPGPGPNQLPVGPGPGVPGQRMPPTRPRSPRLFVSRALNDLRVVKAELQRSQEDYGGHKDSAIAACEKAMDELDAVMKTLPVPVSPQRMSPPPGGPTPPPSVQQPVPPPAGQPVPPPSGQPAPPQ